MSIEGKIKDAFTRRKNAIFDPETQPTLYKMSNFLRKAGYRMNDVLAHGSGVEIILTPIKEDYLHPDITHHIENHEFYVKVKSYGELEPSDLEEVIKGYENALEVIKYLKENLISSSDEIEESE